MKLLNFQVNCCIIAMQFMTVKTVWVFVYWQNLTLQTFYFKNICSRMWIEPFEQISNSTWWLKQCQTLYTCLSPTYCSHQNTSCFHFLVRPWCILPYMWLHRLSLSSPLLFNDGSSNSWFYQIDHVFFCFMFSSIIFPCYSCEQEWQMIRHWQSHNQVKTCFYFL